MLLDRLGKADHIDWSRASLDSASVPAPGGGEKTGPNPIDRCKQGSKRHIVVDKVGVPLAVTDRDEPLAHRVACHCVSLYCFAAKSHRWHTHSGWANGGSFPDCAIHETRLAHHKAKGPRVLVEMGTKVDEVVSVQPKSEGLFAVNLSRARPEFG